MQVLKTKITLPRRRRHLLARQRLLGVLDQINDYRLFMVIAPAGYGKSSLLVDFAHQTTLVTCWYALDILDSNPLRFFNHFVATMSQHFPHFGVKTHTLLNEQAIIDVDYIDRLLVTLINEIHDEINHPFIIFLDDYHLVGSSDLINHFVGAFAQLMDEDCHVVIASRYSIDLPELPLMIARSEVAGLGLSELAFQPPEIQSLFRQTQQAELSVAQAEDLAHDTEGWITGLLMSAETKTLGGTHNFYQARLLGIDVHDYLAQQIFEQQTSVMQSFMLRSALLQEFNVERCRIILGQNDTEDEVDWADLVQQLIKHNLFVTSVDSDGIWLRYHHLFQAFLEKKAEADISEERECILDALGQLYAQEENWEEAYSLYRKTSGSEAVVTIIKQAKLPLVRQGQFNLLNKWLDDLPETLLDADPILISLRGTVQAHLGQVEAGLKLHHRSIALMRQQEDQTQLARILLDRAILYRFIADYDAAQHDINEALSLCEDQDDLLLKADVFRARGTVFYYLGQLDEAALALEQAKEIYQSLNQAQNIAVNQMEIALIYTNMGKFKQAANYNNQALAYWEETSNCTWQANLRNNQGLTYLLEGDYLDSVRELEVAITAARYSGTLRLEAIALANLGDVYLELNGFEAARTVYKQATDLAHQMNERFLILYLILAEARAAFTYGHLDEVYTHLKQAKDMAQESSSAYEKGIYHLRYGELVLQMGNAQEALQSLQRALEKLQACGYQVEMSQLMIYLAVAHQALDNTVQSEYCLAKAFEIGEKMDSFHPLVVAAEKVLHLFGKAMKKDANYNKIIQRVVGFQHQRNENRRAIRQQATIMPFDPPQITIDTLGNMQVILNDKIISRTEWLNQGQMRELFFYLLWYPQGLTKEAIANALWPDDLMEKRNRKVRNTVYRLRQTMNAEAIIFDPETDHYRFNSALDYRYDVEQFRELIDQAKRADTIVQQCHFYEKAVTCYQGQYLPDLDGTWVWVERERLAQDYIQANMILGQLYQQTEAYEAAYASYERILNQEPGLEEAYREAMYVQAMMGNRLNVVRLFERCQQELDDEVGVPVSSQTRELYQTLVE